MKTILCYGDSNTYGTDPAGGPRFDLHTRWPGVMRDSLGPEYWVVEEGCGGRTTVWDDPIERHKNGAAYLPALLHSHRPLDLVVILLGTNDLKHRFGLNADDISRGAATLAELCRESLAGPDKTPPRVLLIAPPPVAPLAGTEFAAMFAGADETSRGFAAAYQRAAAECGCHFLDAGRWVVSSPRDAIHWETTEHAKLGLAVATVVRELLAE
jgi:lysophospholipase L1-like esterase